MLDGFPAKILFLVKKVLFLKIEASCYPIFSQINMPELRYLKKSVLKIVPFCQHTYRASNQHIKKKMLIWDGKYCGKLLRIELFQSDIQAQMSYWTWVMKWYPKCHHLNKFLLNEI